MLEEVLKSVSIVLYEALCCKIFLDIFLQRKYSSLRSDIISVVMLAGVFCFVLSVHSLAAITFTG